MTKNEAAKLLPFVKRRYFIVTAWYIAFQLIYAFGLFLCFGWSSRRPALLPFVMGVPLYFSAFVMLAFHHRWRVRDRRVAASAGYRLCTHCSYDLSGLAPLPESEEHVVCSECGNPINIVEAEKVWRAWAA